MGIFSACTILPILPGDTPNEGRVKINDNFKCLSGTIETLHSITGITSGEVNTASNLSGDEGIFSAKVGSDLQFKSLSAGANVTLSSDTNTITISAVGPDGGENNTASNLGGDVGLFKSKVGSDLQFKSLSAGTNITLLEEDDQVTINGAAGGETNTASNLSGDEGIFSAKVGSDLQFKSLSAGTNITLISDANSITINGSSVADGTGAFTALTASNTIRPINAVGNSVTGAYSSILGGSSNYVGGSGSQNSILGGNNNLLSGSTAVAKYNTIITGKNNDIHNAYNSIIGAGLSNFIYGNTARGTILNGNSNIIKGSTSSILGGGFNKIYSSQIAGGAHQSAIVGGYSNTISGTTSSGYFAFIGAGKNNEIINGGGSPVYSFIGGGYNNLISGSTSAMIGSGQNNKIYNVGSSSLIVGGNNNQIYNNNGGGGNMSLIVGGGSNKIDGTDYNTIVGGLGNTITYSSRSAILVGANNTIESDLSSTRALIVGGESNTVKLAGINSISYSVIVAGNTNYLLNASSSFIGGGSFNFLTGSTTVSNSIIGGGSVNRIESAGNNNSILGGSWNYIQGTGGRNFIGGGSRNELQSGTSYSSTVGGLRNKITNSIVSSIVGGEDNDIYTSPGSYSKGIAIVGGKDHIVSGSTLYSFIGGGLNNKLYGNFRHSSIVGGVGNSIASLGVASGPFSSGYDSVILGGYENKLEVTGKATILNGRRNKINSYASGGWYEGGLIGSGAYNYVKRSSGGIIIGGSSNYVYHSISAFIGAGTQNDISGNTANPAISFATVLNGYQNSVYAENASIINGRYNSIRNSAKHAVIIGTEYRTAETPNTVYTDHIDAIGNIRLDDGMRIHTSLDAVTGQTEGGFLQLGHEYALVGHNLDITNNLFLDYYKTQISSRNLVTIGVDNIFGFGSGATENEGSGEIIIGNNTKDLKSILTTNNTILNSSNSFIPSGLTGVTIIGGSNLSADTNNTALFQKVAIREGAGTGLVLTSDAFGNASWASISGSTGSCLLSPGGEGVGGFFCAEDNYALAGFGIDISNNLYLDNYRTQISSRNLVTIGVDNIFGIGSGATENEGSGEIVIGNNTKDLKSVLTTNNTILNSSNSLIPSGLTGVTIIGGSGLTADTNNSALFQKIAIRDGAGDGLTLVSDANGNASWSAITAGGGGEINTASNVGTGLGKSFKTKVGADLQFKSIAAGTGISIANGTDDITISSTVTGGAFTHTASGIITPSNVYGNTNGGSNYSSILGGKDNTIDNLSQYAAIIGGISNNIYDSNRSLMGGGRDNYMTDQNYSLILGGRNNRMGIGGGTGQGRANFMGGGRNNTMSATTSGYHYGSVIVGGGSNYVHNSLQAFIGAGQSNRIMNDSGQISAPIIVGGLQNEITESQRAVIVGGQRNYINAGGSNNTIVSGYENHILRTTGGQPISTFIGGGSRNYIESNAGAGVSYSVLVGGSNNLIEAIGTGGGQGSAIVGGQGNKVYSPGSFVGAGSANKLEQDSDNSVIVGGVNGYIVGRRSFVGGGTNNKIYSNEGSTIVGGWYNNILNNSSYSFVGGGRDNSLSGLTSTIVGGRNNYSVSRYTFIGGGQDNKIYKHATNSSDSRYAVIVGGDNNRMGLGNSRGAKAAFIGAGQNNSMSATSSTQSFDNSSAAIVAGINNYLHNAQSAFIGAGTNNKIRSAYDGAVSRGIIVGGANNEIYESDDSIIVGGQSNYINSPRNFNVIVGGQSNHILKTTGNNTGKYNFIGGGKGNYMEANGGGGLEYTFIGGGFNNRIYSNSSNANNSVVVGGVSNRNYEQNTFIGGGNSNKIGDSGALGVIVGGLLNNVNGVRSIVVGGWGNDCYSPSSFIGNGRYNVITGTGTKYTSIVQGRNNTINNNNSYSAIFAGTGNTIAAGTSSAEANRTKAALILNGKDNDIAKSVYGTVINGKYSSVKADYGIASGRGAVANRYGEMARATGEFAVSGDAQSSEFTIRRAVSGLSAFELFADGSSERITLTTDSMFGFEIRMVGIAISSGSATTVGDSFMTLRSGAIKNIGGTTSLVGAITTGMTTSDTNMAGALVSVTADNTNDALKIEATNPNGDDEVRWVATVNITEIKY